MESEDDIVFSQNFKLDYFQSQSAGCGKDTVNEDKLFKMLCHWSLMKNLPIYDGFFIEHM